MTWLSGWAKRIQLTIDGDKIDTDLTDFPILVALSSGTGINSADTTDVFDELITVSGSKKIALADSDQNQCYVEIESWDWVNEKAYLWVKAPTLSSGIDNYLYLYYDSTQPDNTSYVGNATESPAMEVWSDNYSAVYHMAQNPSVGGACIKDSTSHSLHGTPNGSMTVGDLIDGKIGKCLDFDGGDDFLSLANSSYLDPGFGTFTISAWFKNSKYYDYGPGFVYSNHGSDEACGDTSLYVTEDMIAGLYEDTDCYWLETEQLPAVDDGVFHHACWVRTTQTTAALYLDTNLLASVEEEWMAEISVFDDYEPRIAGSDYWAEFFQGLIDELRISQIVRSQEYIKADNYSCSNNFISFGLPENVPANYPTYFVIKGLTNVFTAIWADPTASLSSGKMYVGGPGYFNVVNLDNQSICDWYSSTHAGRGNETLVETDIIDGNVVSRS